MLSANRIPQGSSDGFGMTDISLATTLTSIYFDDLPALLVTPGFGFHFWQPPDVLELPSKVFDAYVDVSTRVPLSQRLGFNAGVAEVGYVFARNISSYDVSQFVPNDAVMLQLSTVC